MSKCIKANMNEGPCHECGCDCTPGFKEECMRLNGEPHACEHPAHEEWEKAHPEEVKNYKKLLQQQFGTDPYGVNKK